eukprot:s2948_g4.t1
MLAPTHGRSSRALTICLAVASSAAVCFSAGFHLKAVRSHVRRQVQLRSLPPAFARTPVTDQLVIWQPLFAAVLIFSSYAFIIWKSNRATESRDKRMNKELELRRLRGAQLVRGGGQKRVEMTSFEDLDSADVEAWCGLVGCHAFSACEAELESLKEEEKRDRELIGFGTASPTSRRYSLELSSLPQTDVSREYMLMVPRQPEIDPKSSAPLSSSDEWIESLAVLVFTVVLAADASMFAINPIFQDAPIPLVHALSECLVDKTFKDGEVILQDGEVFQTGKSFVYFIVKGEVEIWKEGNFIMLLQQGETFGELAALRKLPFRQATAKAKGTVACRAVLARSFLQVLEQHPSDLVTEIFEEIMAYREQQLKKKLELHNVLGHKTVDIDFMFFKLPAMQQDERVTPQHQSMAEALKDLQVYEWTATGKALTKKARDLPPLTI